MNIGEGPASSSAWLLHYSDYSSGSHLGLFASLVTLVTDILVSLKAMNLLSSRATTSFSGLVCDAVASAALVACCYSYKVYKRAIAEQSSSRYCWLGLRTALQGDIVASPSLSLSLSLAVRFLGVHCSFSSLFPTCPLSSSLCLSHSFTTLSFQ